MPELNFGDRVGIRSVSEERYLAINIDPDNILGSEGFFLISAVHNHPYLTMDSARQVHRIDLSTPWIICLENKRDETGPVKCGDLVVFYKGPFKDRRTAKQAAYLSVDTVKNAQPSAEVVPLDTRLPSIIWQIFDADDLTSCAKVSNVKQILLRDQFHNFLACGPGGETRMDDRDIGKSNSRWEILRADLPRIAPIPTPLRIEPSQDVVRNRKIPLDQLPLSHQEALLVEDLLFGLSGVEGMYVKLDPRQQHTYMVADNEPMDSSLRAMTKSFLPLCDNFLCIKSIIKGQLDLAFGWVNQSLCQAVNELLREQLVIVAQLESTARESKLTLSTLKYYVQPMFTAIHFIRKVMVQVEGKKGGQVLNAIDQINEVHHLQFPELGQFLMEKAAEPFFQMLTRWLYLGEIKDVCGEFFIKEDSLYENMELGSEYWSRRFTLTDHVNIPSFLKCYKDKILHTGKHLNVVFVLKSQGFEIDESEKPQTPLRFYTRSERDYLQVIDDAHGWACKTVLKLFFGDALQLKTRLNTLRKFFFMGQADFMFNMFDLGHCEFIKTCATLNKKRFDGWFAQAVRTSSLASDPYASEFQTCFHSFPLKYAAEFLSGPHNRSNKMHPEADDCAVQYFSIKWNITHPVCLVVTRTVQLKYQLVFRHLVYCRWVEKVLADIWTIHANTKSAPLQSRQTYAVRQRMLQFIRNYIFYVTMEVIEPRYNEFLKSITNCTTLDELQKDHERTINTMMQEMLIMGKPKLYDMLTTVMDVCEQFSKTISMLHQHTFGQELDDVAKREILITTIDQEQHSSVIINYDIDFNKSFIRFLIALEEEYATRSKDHVHLNNMLTRLNYNEVYTEMMNEHRSTLARQASMASGHGNNISRGVSRAGSSNPSTPVGLRV